MAKRRKRRPKQPTPPVDYADAEGNVLTLRQSLSPGSAAKIREGPATAATSAEDAARRREEMLFERLVVRWEVAGLPLDDQKLLLGRYRMASSEEREWVRRTISAHVTRHLPELGT